MPTPRLYKSDAERQAAFRDRERQRRAALIASKGLPKQSGVESMPSIARWRRMLAETEQLLNSMRGEMETYRDERSEAWQESESAELFEMRLDALSELIENAAQCREDFA